jgi:hypothetical protein
VEHLFLGDCADDIAGSLVGLNLRAVRGGKIRRDRGMLELNGGLKVRFKLLDSFDDSA